MLQTLSALIDALDLAVYSYVKPGAPHRYSTCYGDLHAYIATLTSALSSYARAHELGTEIARGRASLNKSGVGELISNAIRDNRKRVPEPPMLDYHLIMIPVVVAAAYSMKLDGKVTINTFAKGLKGLLMYSGPDDTLLVYEALRGVSGRLGRAVALSDLTPGRIRMENMSLMDLLDAIGKNYATLAYFARRHTSLAELAEKFIDMHLKGFSLNNAAVTTYSILLKDIAGIQYSPVIKSRDDFLKLLKLDREVCKKGKFDHLISLLSVPLFIGMLSIS